MFQALHSRLKGAVAAPFFARDNEGGLGIRFDDVSVRYGATTVLRNLSMRINPGEIVARLGPSGSGKTTALRTVSGFVPPTRGRVFIGDRDVTQMAPSARYIGMVVQNYALFPHMTVAENVAFGLRARRADRATISSRVAQSLAMVGMEAFARRMPQALSGGQQQRVAIARALAIRPDVLLLDEPLSALDAQIRRQMVQEIARLHRELPGLTILYVTHDQHEALTGGGDSLRLTQILQVLHSGIFLSALSNTLRIAVASTTGCLVLGLALAVVLSFVPFPGRGLATRLIETLIALPTFLITLAFTFIYGSAGFVNEALMSVTGSPLPPVDFLYTSWGVVLAEVTVYTPFVLRPLMATFSTLERAQIEVAASLGAGAPMVLRRILLPAAQGDIAASGTQSRRGLRSWHRVVDGQTGRQLDAVPAGLGDDAGLDFRADRPGRLVRRIGAERDSDRGDDRASRACPTPHAGSEAGPRQGCHGRS